MRLFLGLTALIAVATACTIPSTPLSNNITSNFRVQVQNASYPQVHNKYMNLMVSGGGDRHLYVGGSPQVGDTTTNLRLINGSINWVSINAVIGGEESNVDDTVKMFMTERGDPRALFQPTYACNPDTDQLQVELRFVGKQNAPTGGWICVRPSFDNSHEFRYYPPGNTKSDPNRFCIKVTLVAVPT
ncbi:hypothetical protein N0V85_005195 [Neurospora sp. IMI 360204]|nr:hypothetical protein N0V85_005195 [Neurospora sp. IMI 360204]